MPQQRGLGTLKNLARHLPRHGGEALQELIERLILPRYSNSVLIGTRVFLKTGVPLKTSASIVIKSLALTVRIYLTGQWRVKGKRR
jgi:hypothetical protein